MATEKRLEHVSFAQAAVKRQAGQALNVKEFAVLPGVSYSVAREWANLPEFPRFQSVIFWQDFEDWRKQETQKRYRSPPSATAADRGAEPNGTLVLPARAAQILMQAKK